MLRTGLHYTKMFSGRNALISSVMASKHAYFKIYFKTIVSFLKVKLYILLGVSTEVLKLKIADGSIITLVLLVLPVGL